MTDQVFGCAQGWHFEKREMWPPIGIIVQIKNAGEGARVILILLSFLFRRA